MDSEGMNPQAFGFMCVEFRDLIDFIGVGGLSTERLYICLYRNTDIRTYVHMYGILIVLCMGIRTSVRSS